MNNIVEYNETIFENIKHIDEYGIEFWYARELQMILEYKKWQKFINVIDNAKNACEQSKFRVDDHFTQVGKMIELAKGAKRTILDYKLSRYACYLIVQNADSKKEVVDLGQTYFAIQTRKQEITHQEYNSLSDDEKRFYQRKLTKQQKVALSTGVKNMAEFHNARYKGLYNGETADDIFKRKKLRYREDILDNMNEDELVANLFRINQTKQRLIRDNVQGEKEAKDVHYKVSKKVRKAIAHVGGMMPEEVRSIMKYIALLRGINISGKNKISMSELKLELEKNKYRNVSTYLNSGNVIFKSNIDNKEDVMKDIYKIIKNKFNLEIPIIVMTSFELEDILNNNPNWWGTDNKEIYDNLIFIIPPTKYEDVYNTIGDPKEDIEKIKEYNNSIFWSYDLKNYRKSNWWRKTACTNISDKITIRTANTMKKILKICKK